MHVVPRLADDTWHEVLRLLVGALPVAAAERILLAILPESETADDFENRFGLAWQALAEIDPRQISLVATFCGSLTDLLYSWLAYERPGLLPEQIWKLALTIDEAATAIGQISWPCPHPPARQWPNISGLPFACLRIIAMLGNTVWGCPKETKLYLLSMIKSENWVFRAELLDALGKYYRNDPEIKPLLQARAVQDPDPQARSSALYIIMDHFRDDPEAKALLQARALQDPEPGPRAAALDNLAQHFRDDPEMEAVRRAAFLGIAERFKDRELAIVASRDLDGLRPGRDPREPITAKVIANAAEKLGESEGEVRALFAQLAEIVPLTIEPPAAMPAEAARS